MNPQDKQAKLLSVCAVAKSYLGVHEEPHFSNHGPQVEKFLRVVGLDAGNPWCMAFVVACFASANYLSANGTTMLIRTGSCQAQADHAKSIGLLVSADDAAKILQPGWIMLQWHPELVRYAHCGIVTDVKPDGVFWTIEGNTTDQPGVREGDEVCRQIRHVHDVRGGHARYAFIRTT